MRTSILGIIFLGLSALGASAHGICIAAKVANLRRGPSTKYEVSWQVYKYMPLRKLKTQGSWIKVRDFEGDAHWVYKSLVTSKYKCAVVKKKKANVRRGPGSNYPQAKDFPVAEKYVTFRLLKTKGQWAKLKDSFGDSYWIYRPLLWIN